jgi:hypothetical protein
VALPGDDRAVINLPQLFGCADAKRAHEVRDIGAIRAPRPGALATGEPDLFFRNGGELVDAEALDCSPT